MEEQEYKDLILEEDDEGLILDSIKVMWKYEEPFITEGVRLVCEKINPKSVIELGFGYGYTAQQFQDCGVERHIIFEAHPEIYQRALIWAEGKEGVEVINDFWQNVHLDEEVDLVYYDTFEMVRQHKDFELDEEKEHFNFKWGAIMYTEDIAKSVAGPDWIEFELNGEIKYQPLYKII